MNVDPAARELLAVEKQLEAFRRRMGWTFNWVSSNGSSFNDDFAVTLDYACGLEHMINVHNYLDLTPLGRQEDDLDYTMSWVRHHDAYSTDVLAASSTH